MLEIIILKTELAVIMDVPTIVTHWAMVVPSKTVVFTPILPITTFSCMDSIFITSWNKGKVIKGRFLKGRALRRCPGLSGHKRAEHFSELN